jgi:hypothetical protein
MWNIVFNDASIANSASDNLDENSRVEIMLECGECDSTVEMRDKINVLNEKRNETVLPFIYVTCANCRSKLDKVRSFRILNAELLEDDDELSDNDSGKHSDDSSDKEMTTEVSHLSKNDKLQLLHGFKKYSFHETDKILEPMPEKKRKIAGEILKSTWGLPPTNGNCEDVEASRYKEHKSRQNECFESIIIIIFCLKVWDFSSGDFVCCDFGGHLYESTVWL